MLLFQRRGVKEDVPGDRFTKERRNPSAEAHGKPMSGGEPHFIVPPWARAIRYRPSLFLHAAATNQSNHPKIAIASGGRIVMLGNPPMKVTKVCCQGCGADLQIDENIRFVTCNYCNARLEVVHDQTVTHTKQLDKIERTTDGLASSLKVIELQNDLERFDREWDSLRDRLLVRSKDGSLTEPSSAGAVVVGVMVVAFGIFWIGMTLSTGAPGFFPLFGLVFIGFAIFGIISSAAKATEYQRLQAAYQGRRASLIARINRERGG
jgi:DNA-directed RNA polymerase subunit RPC12/RpoP